MISEERAWKSAPRTRERCNPIQLYCSVPFPVSDPVYGDAGIPVALVTVSAAVSVFSDCAAKPTLG